ncbi:hydantoin racemase [Rhodobacterales bacterium HKCCE3408]|nr:hydantoin racemase [Rhodobacterales bacterium HKCCE3408]
MKIIALNPNSSKAVTASMAACLAPLRAATRHEIACTELPDAPIGIESDDDVATVSPMVGAFAAETEADALVVACFSDPGVAAARGAGPVVVGIAEAAYYGALQHGERFGIISIGKASIARHAAHVGRLGLTARLAGDRSLDMSVAEANDADRAAARVMEIGRELREADGADVLILGCAGLGEQRAALQAALGCTVIDPVQAGVAAAITALDLSYRAEG